MDGLVTAAIVGAGLLALGGIAWLLLCLRTRAWRAAAIEHLARARRGLGVTRRARRRLEQQAPAYSPDAPHPYGPVARALHQTLREAQKGYVAAAAGCTRLSRYIEATPDRAGPPPLFRLGLEWRHWRSGFRHGQALAVGVIALEKATARAQEQLRVLHDMPRAVLSRSRELHHLCGQIGEVVPALYAAGLGGGTLDRAAVEAGELCAQLAALPGWCVPAPEMAPLAGATQQSTVAAWQILEQVEAPLHAALTRFQGWKRAYEQAGQALGRMQQALMNAGRRLLQLPDHLDTAPQIEHLGRLLKYATALETRYRSPHLEGLASLQARIDAVLAAADALAAAAESAERDDIYLRQAVPGNTLSLRGLANRMAEAAQSRPCPLDWGSRGERLLQLRRLEQEIGPAEARRTLAQLKGHADLTVELAEAIETLDREVIETLRLRDEWVARTGRPEMALPLLWLGQAQELQRQATRYAAVNWPRHIHVPGIVGSARDLEAQYRRLLPPRPDLPLPAASLPARLARLRGLMGRVNELGEDLRAANERLAQLQAATKQAQHEIDQVDEALGALNEELDRAVPRFAAATARRQRALRQAYRRRDRLAAQLQGKQRRRVEDQARQVSAWCDEVQRLLAAWADALEGEIQDGVQGLRQEVVDLEAVAPFDQEPAMAEARAQLAAHRQPALRPGKSARPPPREAMPLEELAAQGRKWLAERARLHAAREALRAQVGERVHPDRERLEQLERQARTRYDALRELQEACREGWPPLRCDTSAIIREQSELEREGEYVRRTGRTVRQVQTDLRRMAERWQAFAHRIESQEKETRAEWEDLQAQAKQIEAWQERLEAYRRAHRDERDVVAAVGLRLDEIGTSISRAQWRYRQSGLAPDEARRVLDALWAAARADLPVRGRPAPLTAAEIEARP